MPRTAHRVVLALVLVLGAACGRVGFDPLDGSTIGDSATDGRPFDAPVDAIADAAADGGSSALVITAPNGGLSVAMTGSRVTVSGTCDPGVTSLTSSHGLLADDDCADGSFAMPEIDLATAGGHVVTVRGLDEMGLPVLDSILIIYIDGATRYRSVSPGARAALVTAAGAMTVSGITATFDMPLPDSVGLGDVVVYDASGDGTPDVAFVHGRVSARELALRTFDGREAPAVAGIGDWSIFRAYTSLEDAIHGVENGGLPAGLRDFDTFGGGKDLTASGEVWNIACYASGPADTTPVRIDNFTTSAEFYLRIFTPRSIWEVGATQRHAGTWDDRRYRLVASDTDVVNVSSANHLRIEGLQVWLDSVSTDNQKAFEFNSPGVCDFRASHSVFRGAGVSPFAWHSGLVVWSAGSGEARIWNNVAYDFERTSGNDGLGFHLHDPEFQIYAYNNTAYGNRCGIGEDFGTAVTAKNNLSYGNTFNFCGNYTPESTNNLSGPAGTDAPGSSPINAATVQFIDPAEGNFHLMPGGPAQGAGADLTDDTVIEVLDDIDGEPRPAMAPGDIGADQVL